MKWKNSKLLIGVQKPMFLALLVLFLFSISTVFAQGRGKGSKRKQEYKVQARHYYGSYEFYPRPNVAITRNWVQQYPYYSYYRPGLMMHQSRIIRNRNLDFRLVKIRGRNYYLQHGNFYVKRMGRFVRVRVPRKYRNF